MIAEILKKYPFIVLDGSFSTPLERKGFSVNDELWSALSLYQAPELAKEVHEDYFRAGADIVLSASYQATIPGFVKKGFTEEEAKDLLRKSVELVQEARDSYLSDHEEEERPVPLVAASVGPYGAYLADGSEYRGDYGKTKEELKDFHRERIHILWEAGADILGVETIPSLLEAEAIAEVLQEIPKAKAWISFSCKDEKHTCAGDLISDCAKAFNDNPQVEALGLNCTAPEYVESLVKILKKESKKPIIIYPNSGETYDPTDKTWHGHPTPYKDFVKVWYEAGARLIGGCCRTMPSNIEEISDYRSALFNGRTALSETSV